MRLLTLTEAKLLMREPLALFWGLAFPMVLLAVMGLSSATIDGLPLAAVYEPIVIAFISVAFGVQGLPVQVASYREGGILRRLATTPASPVRVIGAQLVVSLAVVLAATAGVLTVGWLGFAVPLPRQPAGFVVAAVLAATAMLGLGLLIGALAPTARSAGSADSRRARSAADNPLGPSARTSSRTTPARAARRRCFGSASMASSSCRAFSPGARARAKAAHMVAAKIITLRAFASPLAWFLDFSFAN